MEILDENAQIKTQTLEVLGKWKSDYEQIFNENNSEMYDQEHLDEITYLVQNPHNNIFPKADCTSLNSPITLEEVKSSVYHSKLRKATGLDNIPAEILRNEHCIDLLFKLIKFAFENGDVPSHWLKGIINPVSKGDDPRCPLNYRPITLLSIPSKIYATILNRRLCTWLDEKGILREGQNGFRKHRSCLDHIYTLHNIVRNRKQLRKDTFACFVDYSKAFDTVDRHCLWFKLLSLGIHGKMFHAIQSLYKSVQCCVKVNEHFTDWFPVQKGVKQGCVMSPTLFSIYVTDLATEINNLQAGVDINDLNIGILLYADDIVLISDTENGLQSMLEKLNSWCQKWRLTVNEKKTKVMHFRSKTKTRSNFVFKCGENTIEYESSYKYLGFWFNEFLDMSRSIREITKSASCALGAVYTKYVHAGGMSYDVYTKLISSLVEPVLFYGAGIWGTRYHKEIDVVLNKACRYFLGTNKNASNIATRGDMGWDSCIVKQKLETVRLWCRLKHQAESRLSSKVHHWSLNIGNSWEKRMMSFIAELNLADVMLVDRPVKSACIHRAKQRLKQAEIESWKNKLMQNGNDQNGNKLRTYRTYKSQFQIEHYVKLNMSRDQRKVLAKFRSCNLPLEIEKGRYTRPKTPLNDRICKFCNSNTIEDEAHPLISCSFYDDIRYELFQYTVQMNPHFMNLTPDEKLIFIMQCPNLQIKLATSLQKMVKRRNVAVLHSPD